MKNRQCPFKNWRFIEFLIYFVRNILRDIKLLSLEGIGFASYFTVIYPLRVLKNDIMWNKSAKTFSTWNWSITFLHMQKPDFPLFYWIYHYLSRIFSFFPFLKWKYLKSIDKNWDKYWILLRKEKDRIKKKLIAWTCF